MLRLKLSIAVQLIIFFNRFLLNENALTMNSVHSTFSVGSKICDNIIIKQYDNIMKIIRYDIYTTAGAQQKTTHNLRLVSADILDFCRHRHASR